MARDYYYFFFFYYWNSLSRSSKKWRKRRKTSAARRRASRQPVPPTARRRHQRRRLVWPTRPRLAQMPHPSTAARRWPLLDWAVEPLLPPLLTTIRSRWPSNKNVSVNNILELRYFLIIFFFCPLPSGGIEWISCYIAFAMSVSTLETRAMEWAKRKTYTKLLLSFYLISFIPFPLKEDDIGTHLDCSGQVWTYESLGIV